MTIIVSQAGGAPRDFNECPTPVSVSLGLDNIVTGIWLIGRAFIPQKKGDYYAELWAPDKTLPYTSSHADVAPYTYRVQTYEYATPALFGESMAIACATSNLSRFVFAKRTRRFQTSGVGFGRFASGAFGPYVGNFFPEYYTDKSVTSAAANEPPPIVYHSAVGVGETWNTLKEVSLSNIIRSMGGIHGSSVTLPKCLVNQCLGSVSYVGYMTRGQYFDAYSGTRNRSSIFVNYASSLPSHTNLPVSRVDFNIGDGMSGSGIYGGILNLVSPSASATFRLFRNGVELPAPPKTVDLFLASCFPSSLTAEEGEYVLRLSDFVIDYEWLFKPNGLEYFLPTRRLRRHHEVSWVCDKTPPAIAITRPVQDAGEEPNVIEFWQDDRDTPSMYKWERDEWVLLNPEQSTLYWVESIPEAKKRKWAPRFSKGVYKIAVRGGVESGGHDIISVFGRGRFKHVVNSSRAVVSRPAFYPAFRTAISVAVVGSNDSAIITGATAARVREGAIATAVGGRLLISDADFGQSVFATPDGVDGTYGSFSFDANTGQWTYTLDNTRTQTKELSEGELASDSLTVTSIDGTATRTIVVTIVGSGDDAGVASASATTGHSIPANLRNVSSDSGDAAYYLSEDSYEQIGGLLGGGFQRADGGPVFDAPEFSVGRYGSFTFNQHTGQWSYAVDVDASQSLRAGQTVIDRMVVSTRGFLLPSPSAPGKYELDFEEGFHVVSQVVPPEEEEGMPPEEAQRRKPPALEGGDTAGSKCRFEVVASEPLSSPPTAVLERYDLLTNKWQQIGIYPTSSAVERTVYETRLPNGKYRITTPESQSDVAGNTLADRNEVVFFVSPRGETRQIEPLSACVDSIPESVHVPGVQDGEGVEVRVGSSGSWLSLPVSDGIASLAGVPSEKSKTYTVRVPSTGYSHSFVLATTPPARPPVDVPSATFGGLFSISALTDSARQTATSGEQPLMAGFIVKDSSLDGYTLPAFSLGEVRLGTGSEAIGSSPARCEMPDGNASHFMPVSLDGESTPVLVKNSPLRNSLGGGGIAAQKNITFTNAAAMSVAVNPETKHANWSSAGERQNLNITISPVPLKSYDNYEMYIAYGALINSGYAGVAGFRLGVVPGIQYGGGSHSLSATTQEGSPPLPGTYYGTSESGEEVFRVSFGPGTEPYSTPMLYPLTGTPHYAFAPSTTSGGGVFGGWGCYAYWIGDGDTTDGGEEGSPDAPWHESIDNGYWLEWESGPPNVDPPPTALAPPYFYGVKNNITSIGVPDFLAPPPLVEVFLESTDDLPLPGVAGIRYRVRRSDTEMPWGDAYDFTWVGGQYWVLRVYSSRYYFPPVPEFGSGLGVVVPGRDGDSPDTVTIFLANDSRVFYRYWNLEYIPLNPNAETRSPTRIWLDSLPQGTWPLAQGFIPPSPPQPGGFAGTFEVKRHKSWQRAAIFRDVEVGVDSSGQVVGKPAGGELRVEFSGSLECWTSKLRHWGYKWIVRKIGIYRREKWGYKFPSTELQPIGKFSNYQIIQAVQIYEDRIANVGPTPDQTVYRPFGFGLSVPMSESDMKSLESGGTVTSSFYFPPEQPFYGFPSTGNVEISAS